MGLLEGTSHYVMVAVEDRDGKPVWTAILSQMVDGEVYNLKSEPISIRIGSYDGSYGSTPYEEMVGDLEDAGVEPHQFTDPPIREMLETLRKKFEGIEEPEAENGESFGPEDPSDPPGASGDSPSAGEE